MPFLMYRDNDSGLRPSSYPYILGRALNQYKINTSVIIYIMVYEDLAVNILNYLYKHNDFYRAINGFTMGILHRPL